MPSHEVRSGTIEVGAGARTRFQRSHGRRPLRRCCSEFAEDADHPRRQRQKDRQQFVRSLGGGLLATSCSRALLRFDKRPNPFKRISSVPEWRRVRAEAFHPNGTSLAIGLALNSSPVPKSASAPCRRTSELGSPSSCSLPCTRRC